VIVTSKKSDLKQIRKKFEEKRNEIKKEHDNLQEKIKKKRGARLESSEKEFRRELSLAVKELVGKEDYDWFTQRLTTMKENEAEAAEKNLEKALATTFREMSPNDYLFRYLDDPEAEKRFILGIKTSKPEDIERLTSIVTKLRLEAVWVDRTLL
jgi:hypothetical protein